MKKWFFIVLSLLAFERAHAINYSLSVDGGVLSTRSDFASPTSTFTLESKTGTFGRGLFSMGNSSFDLLAGGGQENFSFVGPDTRNINGPKFSTTMFEAGFRYKTPFVWTTFTYQGRQAFYLIENSATDFDMKTAQLNFGVMGLTFFGWGTGYKITVDGEYGVPLSQPNTTVGPMKLAYFDRGTVRIEFGGAFRLGVMAGIENQQYTVNTSDKFYRSDFFGGLTLVIGAGKSGGSSGGSRSSGSSSGGSSSPGNFPL